MERCSVEILVPFLFSTKMSPKPASIIILTYLILSSDTIADELHLRNGDRITGRVIELSPTHCVFESNYQAILHLKRNEIVHLNITQPPDDEVAPVSVDSLSSLRAKGTEETTNQSKPLNKSSTPDVLGEPPKEDLRQIFLRQSTVLLNKGEKELDISINYTRHQATYFRTRDFSLPLSLRLGLTKRLEGVVNIPFNHTEQQVLDSQGGIDRNDKTGIGDLSAGLKYILAYQNRQRPDIIGSLNVSVPTGDEGDISDPSSVSLGSGHWHISTGITLVKSYDPAVLFGSIGYVYSFDNTTQNVKVELGNQFNYSFGMGFAINNQITMSTSLSGSYQDSLTMNGTPVPLSSREPISLRTGLTYRLGKKQYLEPTVDFGLNEDAPDAGLTLSYTQGW